MNRQRWFILNSLTAALILFMVMIAKAESLDWDIGSPDAGSAVVAPALAYPNRQAEPVDLTFHPPRNAPTVPLTTTISINCDEPISATTVTSQTFAVYGMQSGLVAGTHGVSSGGRTIVVTPTHAFYPGELVYAVATTRTLNITGSQLFSSTQWQFNAGQVLSRCVGGFSTSAADLIGVTNSSVAWGDYDNDGDLDILLTGKNASGVPVARVYRNDGGAFNAISAGLTGVSHGSVAWGDYDNDGNLDILLTGEDASDVPVAQVYRNDGGTFNAISAGLTGVSNGSVAWGDYDNDSDLDILLMGSSSTGRIVRVYRNDSGSFSAISAGLPEVSFGSVAWGDYDNDGDLDILLTGYDVTGIYRNDKGTFTAVPTWLPQVTSGSAAWGDYDDDGDLDILLAGWLDFESTRTQIWRNEGGTLNFVSSLGLPGVGDSSVAWGDYDNDGDLDILLTGWISANRGQSGSRIAEVYRNDDGAFTAISAGLSGVTNGSAAWGDYDNDGDLDLLVTGRSGSPTAQIYRNDDCSQYIYLPLVIKE